MGNQEVDLGGDEWISYVDEFGRTRVGLKSQLEAQNSVKFVKGTGKLLDESDVGPTLVSGDMERESKRRKWEQEADEVFAEPVSRHYRTDDGW